MRYYSLLPSSKEPEALFLLLVCLRRSTEHFYLRLSQSLLRQLRACFSLGDHLWVRD